jgi:hypothetical protein
MPIFLPPTMLAQGLTYSLWNPSDKNASVTLSNGNRTEASAGSNQAVRCDQGKASGKWMAEITVVSGTGFMFGVGTSGANLNFYPGGDAVSWSYYGANGNKYTNNAGSGFGVGYGAAEVAGLAWDADNGKLYFSKGGVWQASGDPAAGTNPAFSGLSGTLFLMIARALGAQSCTRTTGQAAWTAALPTGFLPWAA